MATETVVADIAVYGPYTTTEKLVEAAKSIRAYQSAETSLQRLGVRPMARVPVGKTDSITLW